MGKSIIWIMMILTSIGFPCRLISLYASHQPAQLEDLITTPNFNYQVYYSNDDGTSTTNADFFPDAKAQIVANSLDTNNAASPAQPGYHQSYLNMGFNAPFFSVVPPEIHV